jgi:hypothetical protein
VSGPAGFNERQFVPALAEDEAHDNGHLCIDPLPIGLRSRGHPRRGPLPNGSPNGSPNTRHRRQAVCSCGWRSERYGVEKDTGTMEALQRAKDAADLHEWDATMS